MTTSPLLFSTGIYSMEPPLTVYGKFPTSLPERSKKAGRVYKTKLTKLFTLKRKSQEMDIGSKIKPVISVGAVNAY
jgi:hypothetical protein